VNWLVNLILGIIKSIFSEYVEHPVEKREELIDVSETNIDNPDDIFSDTDW